MDAPKRKLILVDHNEFSQSVNAIEKSQVLEVIDHHRINDFSTSQPVAFRNEIVGSTATIVATIFRENQIPPVALKAMLTPVTQHWSSIQLHDELSREHTLMHKK